MAALVENVVVEDPRVTGMGDTSAMDAFSLARYGDGAVPNRYAGGGNVGEVIKSQMPELVKGAGMRGVGANVPLANHADIMTRAAQATMDIRTETFKGFRAKRNVVSELNQNWLGAFGALKTALTMPSVMDQVMDLVSGLPGGGDAVTKYLQKSFTAGNIGIGSVSGLVPFNLYAP